MSNINSPVFHLLGTNKVPSGAEIQAIRELIVEGEERLVQKEAELDNMKAAVDMLAQNCRRLREHIDAHKRLLSSSGIKQQFPELLGEIFALCLPSDRYQRINTNSVPFVLSRVCSTWRRVAFSTSVLWCNFTLSSYRPEHASRKQLALKMWLEHSGGHSLSFSLNFNRAAQASGILQAVLAHSSRWKDVEMALPPDLMHYLTDALPLDAPRLRSLKLKEEWPFERSPPRSRQTFKWSPPLLRNLSLLHIQLDMRRVLSFFPVEALTELALMPHAAYHDQLSANDCLTILSMCPSLVKCTLYISQRCQSSRQDFVLVPNLVELTVGTDRALMHPLWTCLILPRLEQVGFDFFSLEEPEPAFLDLLSRSSRCLDGVVERKNGMSVVKIMGV